LSEPAPEDVEVEEPEEEVEETEEPKEEPKSDDVKKLEKAIGRARADAKKARSELAEFRKKAQEGQDLSESESLRAELETLKRDAKINGAVSELFESGFNGSKALAMKMIKTVDDLDDMEAALEELQTDFPERFGQPKKPPGQRPYTGGGRDDGKGPTKDVTEQHTLRLLGRTK
jgi:hypothetical protein